MTKVLVLFAHPALEKSRVNRRLIDALNGLDGVTVNDLYDSYPEFDVDVRREQELLTAHDVVVLQHPFYWYSTPALFKQWQDLVLEHGWAYGSKGKALKGKLTFNAITTGGGETAYQPEGFNKFTISQFLVPFEQTARLCSMKYLPPFVVHGTHRLSDTDIQQNIEDYIAILTILRDGIVPIENIESLRYLNEILSTATSDNHAQ